MVVGLGMDLDLRVMLRISDPGCPFTMIFPKKQELNADFVDSSLHGGYEGFYGLKDRVFVACDMLGLGGSWFMYWMHFLMKSR
ncbi:hypothetical protein NDU88_008319 [Pleurodeles waltl]|uniref:Uncharacterized protein n=1 Tax=Pleurodeles waltl TaxID=8319 RepID=A0AAV7N9C6_PLEWA|nr:hypothetical protein NDU88_008319 [Pleurodeles waltl]